jgi:outer membrane immunogenic protein
MSIKAFPLAIAASVASFATVHAADLPSRKGAPVAPAAYSSLPYNWTGAYIGLGGGYDRTQGSAATGLAGRKSTRSRGAIGGYAGYNIQLGPIVYGLEADAALLSSGSKSNALAGAAKVRERYDGSVRPVECDRLRRLGGKGGDVWPGPGSCRLARPGTSPDDDRRQT